MKKVLFPILLFVLTTDISYALRGWDKIEEKDSLVYTPTDIKPDKIFRVTITRPARLKHGKLKDWFLDSAKQQQAILGEPLKPWVVKPEKNSAWGISNAFLSSKGEKMTVGYQGGTLQDGRVYISQLVSSGDLAVLMKYGSQFNKVIDDGKSYFLKSPELQTSQLTDNSIKAKDRESDTLKGATATRSEVEKKSVPINPQLPLPRVRPPKGLKDLRGVVVMAIQPGGLFGPISDVIATFNDGTYTTDLKRVFAESIAVSKAKKPKRWGWWRMKGGKLQLKEGANKKYETTRGDWIARSGKSNLKLNGCYGNITSASSSPYGGNSTVGNASSWCFKPDGRFSHSSTGFATASGDVMGATSSSKASGGYYRIDDYTARFVYDDGKEIVTAFCFLNEKKSHIAINGKRYMGK